MRSFFLFLHLLHICHVFFPAKYVFLNLLKLSNIFTAGIVCPFWWSYCWWAGSAGGPRRLQFSIIAAGSRSAWTTDQLQWNNATPTNEHSNKFFLTFGQISVGKPFVKNILKADLFLKLCIQWHEWMNFYELEMWGRVELFWLSWVLRVWCIVWQQSVMTRNFALIQNVFVAEFCNIWARCNGTGFWDSMRLDNCDSSQL